MLRDRSTTAYWRATLSDVNELVVDIETETFRRKCFNIEIVISNMIITIFNRPELREET